ncbi:MAG: glycosyltransferase [Oscillospiraceae bacterium]|nr:glycosyltransferase [Oscillospiraceae bacterium]
MKLITFAVPCYNFAEYMSHCIETLLSAGEDAEIILVDDGSTDNTAAIADDYAARYPTIVRAIHQPNGGHGEGVNQGIRNATGYFYKVVDSDDWLNEESLARVMDKLRQFRDEGQELDLMICNYVYEHVQDNTSHTVNYENVFPVNRLFTWEDVGHFRESQYLLMHSAIYRTQLLRDNELELPKHTFYVDNIFVYQPLPAVKTMYYMSEDLYRYFIGRVDQSVNESVMVKRVDQQIRVTKLMTECCDLQEVYAAHPRLAKYMFRYLAMMYTICSILLVIDGSEEALAKRDKLWEELKAYDEGLYRRLRYRSLALAANLPGTPGRKIGIAGYHVSQKIFKFN